uniref:Uncharacterized protein n=1 Tax=Aegilops tauschii subsp. strangulata TaxID=200361 RepID=A0A453A0I1_AEGTS
WRRFQSRRGGSLAVARRRRWLWRRRNAGSSRGCPRSTGLGPPHPPLLRRNSSYALLQSAKQGCDCENREKLLREIHNMREELYDKVSHAERTYNIPGRAGKHISRLREELARQT